MNLDELRKWQSRQPFEAFQIVLVDGRVFDVPHPEFIWVPPGKGSWVYIADPETNSADHINTMIISSIRKRRDGQSRRRKAG